VSRRIRPLALLIFNFFLHDSNLIVHGHSTGQYNRSNRAGQRSGAVRSTPTVP